MNVSKSTKAFVRKAINGLHPLSHLSPVGSQYTLHDMMMLDRAYKIMNRGHDNVHRSLIRRLRGRNFTSVLEVACGTGWNVPAFREAGLKYSGLDISDTAIAIAALKYPENQYFNLAVTDCGIFKDDMFDVVYNSAMLEHIGYCKEAMLELIRLARYEACFLFFDGLSEENENVIEFHSFDDDEVSGKKKNIYGRKFVLQGHVHNKEKGWYSNRYSKPRIVEWLQDTHYEFEVIDSSNTSFIANETVVIVRK